MLEPGSTEAKTLIQYVDRLRHDATEGWVRAVCNRAEINRLRETIKSLQWGVAESEVLRDPALPPGARKLLTELVDLKL